MEEVRLNGYHVTASQNCDNIINNGFQTTTRLKHYLGQGIYFFADEKTAKYNVYNTAIDYGDSFDKSIIQCEIKVQENEFLNLDDTVALNTFKSFWNDTLKEITENNICLEFVGEPDFVGSKHLYYKCYMLDLYKAKYNYKVVLKTFSIDTPSYGVKISNLKFSGLPYLERYICVENNNYIYSKNIIYSNQQNEEDWFI